MGILKDKFFAIKQAAMRFAQGSLAYPSAKIKGNCIFSYWGFGNFGDLITPLLLKKTGYTPVHCPRVRFSDFVFVGSVLDSINDNYAGVILGSGFLNNKMPRTLNKAKVLGVRGKLSKELLGIKNDIQLGDGGLILAKFLKERPAQVYQLGVIPHYADAENPIVLDWKKRFGDDVKFINVRQSPEKVFYEICSCKYIVSSSLHGLVAADSIGSPSLWMSLSDLSGNKEFKFHDYYSAFDQKRESFAPCGDETIDDLINLMTPVEEGVFEATECIYKLFLSLPNYFPRNEKGL